jgi:hypothetical protein
VSAKVKENKQKENTCGTYTPKAEVNGVSKTRSDEFKPESAGLLAASQTFSYESNFNLNSEHVQREFY